VFARRFSSAGTPLAAEFQVNTYTYSAQTAPTVAGEGDGDFLVAWSSYSQDGDSYGIFARRFSSAGAALAEEFQVNTYTGSFQTTPSAAIDAGGDFVVAWQSQGQDGAGNGVFARRFSSAGAALGVELQVSASTIGAQASPSVTAELSGDFVVAWTGDDGSGGGIFARRFSSAGAALTGNFQVNTFVIDYQGGASLAAQPDDDFVVAWSSQIQDGSSFGIFGQRIAPGAILDIDGNGATTALTDGLLVLRFLFSFTGTTLTTGVVGEGCSRCSASEIETYLDSLTILDIDGNGSTTALTDGLLVLRFLFGFTGETLTTGAVGGGCSRCDAASIEAYLQPLV
jgi:hypothetical protein